MSKITKSALKDLIKECVKDMIREGDADIAQLLEGGSKKPQVKKVVGDEELWDSLVEVATGSKKLFRSNNKKIKAPNAGVGYKSEKKINEWVKAAYNKFGGEWIEQKESVETIQEQVSQTPTFQKDQESIQNGVMSNKLMNEIFADTAKNTLVKQEQAKGMGQAADAAAQHMKDQDPTELFGESSKNWSSLAFGE